ILSQPRRDALTIQETDWSPSFRNQRGQEAPSATWKKYLGPWSGLHLVWLRYFCGSLFFSWWSQWCTYRFADHKDGDPGNECHDHQVNSDCSFPPFDSMVAFQKSGSMVRKLAAPWYIRLASYILI